MKVIVKGKSSFVSKKNGQRYFVLDLLTPYSGVDCMGEKCVQQFVGEQEYNLVTADKLGKEANIYYNNRGFVEAFVFEK